ncbi:MAG: hypothetical protein KIT14_22120 [bacterium]|nr:hypothetical protein [bacterium]
MRTRRGAVWNRRLGLVPLVVLAPAWAMPIAGPSAAISRGGRRSWPTCRARPPAATCT